MIFENTSCIILPASLQSICKLKTKQKKEREKWDIRQLHKRAPLTHTPHTSQQRWGTDYKSRQEAPVQVSRTNSRAPEQTRVTELWCSELCHVTLNTSFPEKFTKANIQQQMAREKTGTAARKPERDTLNTIPELVSEPSAPRPAQQVSVIS